MRIDGFSSHSLTRPSRSGGAVTPYRDSQRAAEQQREQAAPNAIVPSGEGEYPLRRVEPGSAVLELRSTDTAGSGRFVRPGGEPVLNAQAARALASYASTASFSRDPDAGEVLGLDLYA